jgi:hypothetical protein
MVAPQLRKFFAEHHANSRATNGDNADSDEFVMVLGQNEI